MILILFLISLFLFLLWLGLTKSFWRVKNEVIAFPMIFYILSGILIAIPIANIVFIFTLIGFSFKVTLNDNPKEFLAAISLSKEEDIEFIEPNDKNKMFKKF